MPASAIHIEDLLLLYQHVSILDVRSPGEYEHAHIPGAISFPLFTNDERRVIGTSYKQESREKAIKIGLDSFGKNMVTMVEEAEKILLKTGNSSREVIVHCWRGGMRSAAVAWLLDFYGFKVYLLVGGYKAYRKWVTQQFEKSYSLGIIGGYTGSNKTGILQELRDQNEKVIDLEALAGHRGSSFGNLERKAQCSQEEFENKLAFELYHFSIKDPTSLTWMENESQRIGNINMPPSFYRFFSEQSFYFIDVPFEERLKHILNNYGKASKESLINAIVRITKKLGGLEAKTAVSFLMDDDIESCFRILLNYYDRLYHKSMANIKQTKKEVIHLECNNTDPKLNLQKILKHANAKR